MESQDEMEWDTDGAWKGKCQANDFTDISATKEDLTNLIALGAKNISVKSQSYNKSSFKAKVIEITSTNSKFPSKEEFEKSLKLGKTDENGENNNFGDGRKGHLMIQGNVLVLYGDTTLGIVYCYYSSKNKQKNPSQSYTREFIKDKKDKILKLYKDCETFKRVIIFEHVSRSLEVCGIDEMRPLKSCLTKELSECNLEEEEKKQFEDKSKQIEKMIGRDYGSKLEQGIYFQGLPIKENSRFKDEYIKKEESGDKDLIIYNIEIYKEKRGNNFKYKIISIKDVPKDKEKKGWINLRNKKLTVNKNPEKGITKIGTAELRVYYIDKSIKGIQTDKEDQTIAIFREGMIIADVSLRYAFEKASQLRTDFVYQGSDDIFELRPNKTKTTFKPKVMDLILKLIRYGTDDIFPSYKDKGKTSEPVPNDPAQEQVPGPAPEPDNDPNQEGRKELNGEDKEKSWDKLYGGGRDAICVTCNSQQINCLKTDKFHWAHILAHSKGGECNIENMIPICRNCNLSMGNTHMFIWVKDNKLEEVTINFLKIMRNYLEEII